MIAKFLDKIFALDGHVGVVEYAIITVLVVSAFVASAVAVGTAGAGETVLLGQQIAAPQ
jgi:hypothetical protein